MPTEIWEFFWAWLGWYEPIVTGLLVTALLQFIPWAARKLGHKNVTSVPSWVKWSVVGAGVLIACFGAWRDQYRERLDAQAELDKLSKPIFRFELSNVVTGEFSDEGKRYLSLIIEGAVSNVGAPSTCTGYRLRLRSSEWGEWRGMLRWVGPEGITLRDSHDPIVYKQSELLAIQTNTDPMPTGARRVGYLNYAFLGRTVEELGSKKIDAILELVDVHGTTTIHTFWFDPTSRTRKPPTRTLGLGYEAEKQHQTPHEK
jgi:hypothetical protein